MSGYAVRAKAEDDDDQITPTGWPPGWVFPGPPWPPGFQPGNPLFSSPSPADGATETDIDSDLSWSFSWTCSNYEIMVDDVVVGTASSAAYALSTLDEETEYTWRVFATVGGVTYVSSEWSFRTPLFAPTSFTATANGSTQIDLTWDDNSDECDAYIIDRSLNGSTWAQLTSEGGDATSYSDTGLSPSTQYYYRIRAYAADWGSSDYDTDDATTDAITLGSAGMIRKYESSYPPSANTNVYDVIATGYTIVGQLKSGAVYYSYRTYFEFTIPDGAISSASLKVYPSSIASPSAWSLRVYSIPDWGTLDAGDWSQTGTLLASVAASTLGVGSLNTITLDHTLITPGASLYLWLVSSLEEDASPPTGDERGYITTTGINQPVISLA